MSIEANRDYCPTLPSADIPRPFLIFDFDGTIADSLAAVVGMVNAHAAELRISPLGDDDVEELRGLSSRAVVKKLKIPLIKIPSLMLRSQKEIHRHMDKISIFPGVRDLILDFKRRGIGLGILTSNSRENVRKFLQANGVDVFDFIHSESNLFGKNRALSHLLKTHGLQKSDVIYVGDETRDIEACHRVRVAVIAVSWGFQRRELLIGRNPTYMVDTPAEIRSIVFNEPLPA